MKKISKHIVIIGGGPAGLMAAHQLLNFGHKVSLYEAKPSLARKFQLAGRGGLNLTHSEDLNFFANKYYENSPFFTPLLNDFSPQDLREFCHALGQDTFVGSSGRVFPTKFKATELLRQWITKLNANGLQIFTRHRWLGFDSNNNLLISNDNGKVDTTTYDAAVFALGGASWPRMGSDGSWVDIFAEKNVDITPLRPANCGFETNWPSHISSKTFGHPLKNISISLDTKHVKGEIMLSNYGLEGGAIYALSKMIREKIEKTGEAQILIDLKPIHPIEKIEGLLAQRKTGSNLSRFLKQELHLSIPALELLKAYSSKEEFNSPFALARLLKSLPITLTKPRPLERAISTAGGIKFSSCNSSLMLKELPNVFVTGEMLDWEAPTGGYLLQGCFSMAVHVAKAIDEYLT
ncbi:MAG: TIGR03862 family flavoprotein [Halopseudomonas aestusnigri]